MPTRRPDGTWFLVGNVIVTRGAARALDAAGENIAAFLDRHTRGDWGENGTFDPVLLERLPNPAVRQTLAETLGDLRTKRFDPQDLTSPARLWSLLQVTNNYALAAGRYIILSRYPLATGATILIVTSLDAAGETLVIKPGELWASTTLESLPEWFKLPEEIDSAIVAEAATIPHRFGQAALSV
jgi:hypothetical protein